MELFNFLTKWFWVVCIIVTFLNAAAYRFRARRQIQANPELEGGYRTLIRGFVLWGILPWVIMGVGTVFGGVPSVLYFFRPRDGNPFVLAFFASVFLEWILVTYWLLYRGGAQMLVTHPGLLNVNLKTPRSVVLCWFLSLACGIIAVILMFANQYPLPFR
jgi:hypothetical protein